MSNQSPNGTPLDEWKEARAVIARFDTNLHDLRKYGFSFVTALLAANGLLSIGSSSAIPAGVKAAILIVTLGLLIALKLLDTHYRCFQEAASTRALILEDRLNLSLTTDIFFYYNYERWWKDLRNLYWMFVMLTVFLGFAILWSEWSLIGLVVLFAVSSGFLMHQIDCQKSKKRDYCDWSVDKKIVQKGTPIRVTYTNISHIDEEAKKPRELLLLWAIEEESKIENLRVETDALGNIVVAKPLVKAIVCLRNLETYHWLWSTDPIDPGFYKMIRYSINKQNGKFEVSPIGNWERISIQVTSAPI